MPYSGKVLLFYEEGVLELLPLVAHFGLQPLITNICKDLADFSTSYLFYNKSCSSSFTFRACDIILSLALSIRTHSVVLLFVHL
jgi:hypothetical protein